jgi:GNAT superfamily N-acetyltransferase
VYSSQAGNLKRVAYCHYRWEEDPIKEDQERGTEVHSVGYVYELQLERAVQGCGLGSFLMETVAAWVRPSPASSLLCHSHPHPW